MGYDLRCNGNAIMASLIPSTETIIPIVQSNTKQECDYKRMHKNASNKMFKSKHVYRAKKKSDLIGHLKSKHEGAEYPCNQCYYKASENSLLIRHLKSKHEQQKRNDLENKISSCKRNHDQKEDNDRRGHQNATFSEVLEEVNETNFDQAFENCFSLILKSVKRTKEADSEKKMKRSKACLNLAPAISSRYWTLYTKEENSTTPGALDTTNPYSFEASIPAPVSKRPRLMSPELEERAEEYTDTDPGFIPVNALAKEEPSPVRILLRRNDVSSWTCLQPNMRQSKRRRS